MIKYHDHNYIRLHPQDLFEVTKQLTIDCLGGPNLIKEVCLFFKVKTLFSLVVEGEVRDI